MWGNSARRLRRRRHRGLRARRGPVGRSQSTARRRGRRRNRTRIKPLEMRRDRAATLLSRSLEGDGGMGRSPGTRYSVGCWCRRRRPTRLGGWWSFVSLSCELVAARRVMCAVALDLFASSGVMRSLCGLTLEKLGELPGTWLVQSLVLAHASPHSSYYLCCCGQCRAPCGA